MTTKSEGAQALLLLYFLKQEENTMADFKHTTKADLYAMNEELIAKLDDATIIITDATDRITELNDRVYNLTLYLDCVRQTDKKLWNQLKKTFNGLPGFDNKTAKWKKPKEEKPAKK